MFNYKENPFNKKNKRYNNEEYLPQYIEKMYMMGKKFPYENKKNSEMNYSIKSNKLKESTKELNDGISSYKDDMDKLYKENKFIKNKFKENYKSLKDEIDNGIQNIENEIERKLNQQKIIDFGFKYEMMEMKKKNVELENLVKDIEERVNNLNKAVGEKENNIGNDNNDDCNIDFFDDDS